MFNFVYNVRVNILNHTRDCNIEQQQHFHKKKDNNDNNRFYCHTYFPSILYWQLPAEKHNIYIRYWSQVGRNGIEDIFLMLDINKNEDVK